MFIAALFTIANTLKQPRCPLTDEWIKMWHMWCVWASPVAELVKNLPAMQETWVWSLSREDPLEKERATHSSILAWRSPWTEEPGRLQSMGLRRVRHDCVTNSLFHFSYTHTYTHTGFHDGSNSAESACSAEDTGLIPEWGRPPGEVNGYPLQYSHLDNYMDSEAGRAKDHGVSKSRTQLSK